MQLCVFTWIKIFTEFREKKNHKQRKILLKEYMYSSSMNLLNLDNYDYIHSFPVKFKSNKNDIFLEYEYLN